MATDYKKIMSYYLNNHLGVGEEYAKVEEIKKIGNNLKVEYRIDEKVLDRIDEDGVEHYTEEYSYKTGTYNADDMKLYYERNVGSLPSTSRGVGGTSTSNT